MKIFAVKPKQKITDADRKFIGKKQVLYNVH